MKECDMIKDLLPLYADDVCSDESRRAVEAHIKDCPDCKAELEKLGKNVVVSPQKDADVLKRIKKRLRIEKITVGIISCLSIVCVVLGIVMFLLNTDQSMDVNKYDIKENVYAVERDNAVWLCIKGKAGSFDYMFPTVSDTSGNHMGYDSGFKKDNKNGYGFTLKERKIVSLAFTEMMSSKTFEVRLFDVDEQKEYDKVFYYDDVNNKEYILWERD